MRILLVFYNYGSGISFHPGLQILSALAKQKRHEVKLLHFHEKLLSDDPKAYLTIAKEYKPDLIGFTATDFEFDKVNEIAKQLKNHIPAFYLLGGKSAIEIASKDPVNTPFDGFCYAEAEIPFLELLEKLEKKEDYTNIKSMWFKKDFKIIKNPIGDYIRNLDDLPFLDYDIFDTPTIIKGKGGWLSLQFSRGCLYNCTYCVDAESMIATTKGLRKAKNVEIGDRVISSYPNIPSFVGNHIIAKKITEKELIEIELENGESLKVTADHRIKTTRKTNRGWIEAKDLSITDRIAYIDHEILTKLFRRRWESGNFNPKYSLKAESNPNWKGGKTQEYYRRIAFEKYGKKCVTCGRNALDINHKDGNHYNNKIENLEPICRKCHMLKDGRLNKFRENSKKLDRSGENNPRWNSQLHRN